jgi:iron(III) transport system substrate-binding protein
MTPVLTMEPIVIMVNTAQVKTPVTGQKDLLRPEFKGKIGIEELASTFVYAWYDQVEKTEEAGYLTKLAANQPRIYASTPAGAQMVASGEVAVANFINMGAAVATLKQGAPVRIVIPTPVFANQYNGGIMGWSKRPNAAQVLLDFLMSKEGQEAWSGDGASASPLAGVPNALDARGMRSVDLTPYTAEVTRTFKTRFDGLFRR